MAITINYTHHNLTVLQQQKKLLQQKQYKYILEYPKEDFIIKNNLTGMFTKM